MDDAAVDLMARAAINQINGDSKHIPWDAPWPDAVTEEQRQWCRDFILYAMEQTPVGYTPNPDPAIEDEIAHLRWSVDEHGRQKDALYGRIQEMKKVLDGTQDDLTILDKDLYEALRKFERVEADSIEGDISEIGWEGKQTISRALQRLQARLNTLTLRRY